MSEPNIFDSFPLQTKQSIIVDPKYLDTKFVPDELPHRAEQIKDLVELIGPALPGQPIQSISIYGPTGTGKTAVITYVGREFKRKVAAMGKCIPWVSINCFENTSEYSVIRKFCCELEQFNAEIVIPPVTGYSMPQMITTLGRNLENFRSPAILVLDEIDRLFLKKDDGNSVLYTVSELPVHVISITNDIDFEKRLDPRVISRLDYAHSRIFQSYNATDLTDILSKRAEHAFKPKSVDSGVIQYCAALVTQKGGDARVAINLLRFAAQEADRSEANKILRKHVEDAVNCMQADITAQTISYLNLQQSILLLAVMNTLPYENYGAPKTGTVYKTYETICMRNGLHPLTQRRMKDYLDTLVREKLILMQSKSFGRGGGRTSLIRLCVPQEEVIDGLKKKINEFPELEKIIERATELPRRF
jgi:cell division control protein 6